ncbi:hypothetical protein L1049_028562 [Liquidambar formosana]|uniref:Uncharacterized protein n=1 Tax=Liquidambar formosana TaxID=63359 RepID=A0AAP0WX65_LIQFO
MDELMGMLLASQAGCAPDDICDFELQACDTQPSIVAGAMKEFIFSGRLDNLCMSFCFLKLLATQIGCEPYDICDFELQACDTQRSIVAGAMKEFIFSGRLDNLCISFCSLKD